MFTQVDAASQEAIDILCNQIREVINSLNNSSPGHDEHHHLWQRHAWKDKLNQSLIWLMSH